MMNVQLRGIYDHLKQMGLPIPMDNFGQIHNGIPPNELVKISCHSVDQPQNFLNIERKGKVVMGRGQVFQLNKEGSNFINGKPIAPNNVKVCVDEVLVEFQVTHLPMPCDEHKTVGDAAGSFVQWPEDLVILGQCPQQEGGTECGYFVMRYMYDIIMLSRNKDPKIKWKEVLGKRYKNEQIGEIRDIWADFFTREYM
ncbi:uncharacterized protein LOC141668280 [Apium graveolens]|uniref:uncharacterized protein LOC141668280 n=1 Tax=Apium graveolens TaxID=4045 RepID=UPI003D7B02AA